MRVQTKYGSYYSKELYEKYTNLSYRDLQQECRLQQVISNVEKSNNIIGAQWKISGYDEETLIIAFSINFDPSDHYILVRAESIEC
jgi:hypothetical protein